VVAERVTGGNYIDIDIDREAAARYGVNVGDIQDVIETAWRRDALHYRGGRNRFPIRIRYLRDYRDSIPASAASWSAAWGAPSAALAGDQAEDLHRCAGDQQRGGLLRFPLVFLNVRGRDMGGFVTEAKQVLEKNLKLPPGYYVAWSGQWENQIRAKARLQMLVPIGIVIIFTCSISRSTRPGGLHGHPLVPFAWWRGLPGLGLGTPVVAVWSLHSPIRIAVETGW